MELTKEFTEEHKLDEAQVTAITTFAKEHITELKGGWDSKANTDAEAILGGAADKIKEITGLERDKGQKMGDYINAAWDTHSTTKTKELTDKIAEFDKKIKDTSGNETLVKEHETLKSSFDTLQKKEADFNTLLESGVKDKYEELQGKHSVLKLDVAFSSVKPNFPDATNSFEADARWEAFKKRTLESSTMELVDGQWMAVNKENKHKVESLKDLISKDADITKLLEGRQQKGPDGKEKSLIDIDGIPFKVPEDADSIKRSELIKDHLRSKNLSPTSSEWTRLFTELNGKMLKARKAA